MLINTVWYFMHSFVPRTGSNLFIYKKIYEKLVSGRSRISHWGALTRWGGTNLQRIHFSAKTYAKTKEIDPVVGRAPAVPPGSANG